MFSVRFIQNIKLSKTKIIMPFRNNSTTNVFSKLSSLVSSGLINFARFTNHITCFINVNELFCGFGAFCKAYNDIYGFRTDTGMAANTLKGALFMFIGFKRMHCSELFSFMQQSQYDFKFPEFIHCIFETIVVNVKSTTLSNSWIYGNLVITGMKLDEIMQLLKDKAESKDEKFFLDIFEGTGLEAAFLHSKNQASFYTLLIKECDYFLVESATLDSVNRNNSWIVFITRAFLNIEQITSHVGIPKLNISVQKYKNGSSQHLSIYRFAGIQGYSIYEYLINLKSLEGLSNNMLSLFVCFLFIFRPTFSIVASVLPGYEPFNFASVNEQACWKLYLSCSRIRPPRSRTRAREDSENQQTERVENTPSSENNTSSCIDVGFIGRNELASHIQRIVHLLSQEKLSDKRQPVILVFT
jgi:hypothetical protein